MLTITRAHPEPPPKNPVRSVTLSTDSTGAPGVMFVAKNAWFEVTYRSKDEDWPSNRWHDIGREELREIIEALTSLLEDNE